MTGFYILTAVCLLSTILPTKWRMTAVILSLACLANWFALPFFDQIAGKRMLVYTAMDSLVGLILFLGGWHGAHRMCAIIAAFIVTHCLSLIGTHSNNVVWFYNEYESIINALNVLQALTIGGGVAYDLARRNWDRHHRVPDTSGGVSVRERARGK